MYAVMRVVSSAKEALSAFLATESEEWQSRWKSNSLYEKYVFCT
jgi:hypothetical protein